jgi:hypothetical protein
VPRNTHGASQKRLQATTIRIGISRLIGDTENAVARQATALQTYLSRETGTTVGSHPTGWRRSGKTGSREYNSGYTETVKTAVSMPDDLFLLAEAAARRLRVSRSELYAKAIAEYLKRQQSSAITERLNEVYSSCPAKLDPVLHRAQLKSLGKDDW